MQKEIKNLLDRACEAYDKGTPFISDSLFDELANKYDYHEFSPDSYAKKGKHEYKMYSLQKVFDKDPEPSTIQGQETLESPKLDGAAISLLYIDGYLVRGLTRGDGDIGEDITDKVYLLVPSYIPYSGKVQISGEVVANKNVENSRNIAAGALHKKDIEEFKVTALENDLCFVAYNVYPYLELQYLHDMQRLKQNRFHTILDRNFLSSYPTDGTVYRINDNQTYENLGYTAKHPRGAYARKKSSDVETKETTLLDVIWQVGSSGKVTPVGIFEEINIDGANVNRATLHNKKFIEDMELDIGDTILVTRSGGIIPKVITKL